MFRAAQDYNAASRYKAEEESPGSHKEVVMNWQLAMMRSRAPASGERPLRGMTRRQFARTAAGTAMAGAVIGAGSWRGNALKAFASTDPVPIAGGSPVLGGAYHIFGPGPAGSLDPIDAEPATIGDFNGVVALAYINGTVTRTNTKTGEVRVLPMMFSDMRLMHGVYRGEDGNPHQGAFALV